MPVPWRTGGAVRSPVALGGLPPPAFYGGLGEHDVLVDAPLAGRPAQDFLGRAGEMAVDPRHDPPIRGRPVALQEVTGDVLAGPAVEASVDPLGAAGAGGEPRSRRDRAEVNRRAVCWRGAERRGRRRRG